MVGPNAKDLFANESGGHRWQRVPPTEKKGRVHTSTITVAVMSDLPQEKLQISDEDLFWEFIRGSGAGGQHRNKTSSCVRVTHIPTGTCVKIDSRSQSNNKKEALEILYQRLNNSLNQSSSLNLSQDRKNQVGSGQRGDKIRTIRVRDDIVTNNISGKKISFSSYEDGDFQDLNDK